MPQIQPFCYHERNKVGINIYNENKNVIAHYDLSVIEAKYLIYELQNVLHELKQLEK